jgi:hypothetical protein
VREAEYLELSARQRASLLRGVMFIHLKKELEAVPKNWRGCEEPEDPSQRVQRNFPVTSYGIRKDVQALLADIRTDLDSFSDLEAYALMASGYQMTQYEFPRSIKGVAVSGQPPADWSFLRILSPMQQRTGVEKAHDYLQQILSVAQHQAFKIWRLSPALKSISWILGIIGATGLAWACWQWRTSSLLTLGALGIILATVVIGWVFGKTAARVVRYQDTLRQIAMGLVMGVLGALLARLHIEVFDRWFLARGKLKCLGLPVLATSQSFPQTDIAPSPELPPETEPASQSSHKKAAGK